MSGETTMFLYWEKDSAPEIQVFNFSEEGVKLLINRFFRNIFEFLFLSKALVDILAYILLAFLCIFNRPVFCNPKVNIGHVWPKNFWRNSKNMSFILKIYVHNLSMYMCANSHVARTLRPLVMFNEVYFFISKWHRPFQWRKSPMLIKYSIILPINIKIFDNWT